MKHLPKKLIKSSSYQDRLNYYLNEGFTVEAMNDVHPTVRQMARKSLSYKFAEANLKTYEDFQNMLNKKGDK